MDIWMVANGLIYLLCFAMVGWMLQDALSISKK